MTTVTKTPVAPSTAETQSAATANADPLQQLSEIAGLVASARDAMSDEIVTRLACAFSEGIALLDRVTRNQGLMRLMQVLDHPDSQQLLIGLAEALRATSRDVATTAPANGGMRELLQVTRQPGTMEGIRILAVLGQHLSDRLREQHRHGS